MSAVKYSSPPAPEGVPIFDMDPFGDDFLTNPYAAHHQMRELGPFVWIPKYSILATGRHDEVRTVLGDPARFISSAGVGLANFRKEEPFRPKSLILEADPPDHTAARSVLARILSPKAVTQIRVQFTLEAEALADRLLVKAQAGEVIDGVTELSEVYPLKVFPDAVGVPDVQRENLLTYGNMIFNAFGPRNALFEQSVDRVKPVTEWIMAHCQRENLAPGGFGEAIFQAADAGEITHAQAPLLVRSFLSAGVDTTVNGIGNALDCFARHPEQWTRLRAEPLLARHAFEEALRYESSVQTFFRTAAHDTDVSGVHIAQDHKVVTYLGAANRDPRKWPQPDTFDIGRRPAGHMAFGFGIHACVGQVVARLEGELILTALAKRFKAMEIAGPPVRRLNNTLRALASLPLRLIPA